MDNVHSNTAFISCKNIFKSDAKNRKENLTKKMAELINQQERAKQIYIANDT
ncbi:MAG: hypothetical protein FWG94_04090 [Oscillospiraceae bacterium]|nr:hypothetical protein [Oscillospiraceae bacterium]